MSDLDTSPRPAPRSTAGGPRVAAFPPDFLWGAATSAYQIEGGVDLDGRGPSIWDTFSAAGHAHGDTGAAAADHRRRMRADVALMARLGLAAYRFSISWPRVQPSGAGAVSASGLDFYRALVDELLANGIEPVATLYHWDLPQALEDVGGWVARPTAERFADYAAVVAGALGDRVRRWTTINEPWCSAMLGYAAGVHAPGHTDPGAAVAAAHHLLLGHGLAVDALRAGLRHDPDDPPEIGITLNPYPVVAATEGDADRDAARRIDGLANRIWYDPVLRGAYPDDVLADLATVSDLAHIRDGDLAVIARPIDALGLNYYRRHHVRHALGASVPPSPWPGSPDVAFTDPESTPTSNGWAVEPRGLYESLVRVAHDYDAPPLYVHENGGAFPDLVASDGAVHDADRQAFLAGHLQACADAIADGVDLRGFFVWSLLDNFEWAEGYTQRFGVVRVDFATQERTPKDSALWYREVVRANAVVAVPATGPPDGGEPG
ncbi:MAG TPA: GH1 family beta-glucosidase [Acidimicrobiales bacterium]|nr:GH1 family beta-glucosidase [Acidimicrobiales bacterium]